MKQKSELWQALHRFAIAIALTRTDEELEQAIDRAEAEIEDVGKIPVHDPVNLAEKLEGGGA